MSAQPREVAWAALRRIEWSGAYANLLGSMWDSVAERDRPLVTELVYGTTRMRRACDYLVDRYLVREPDPEIRTLLRLGAYQLHFTDIPDHAAVDTIVSIAPKRLRGFVNAVLRKVAVGPVQWPDEATRLSYPDWIVDRLVNEIGHDEAHQALAHMNRPASRTERGDGYVQDLASQWVAAAVEAQPGERVADLCAAPGGKATAIAAAGAHVVAADLHPHRSSLLRSNVRRLGASVSVITADATRPPLRAASFDRVLLDAPCSGLGALRRRPDARWRIEPDDIERLARMQSEMLAAAMDLVRPGGQLVYSVCTLTRAESLELDHPQWCALDPVGPPWRPWGRGALLLPQDADTDGMVLLRWVR